VIYVTLVVLPTSVNIGTAARYLAGAVRSVEHWTNVSVRLSFGPLAGTSGSQELRALTQRERSRVDDVSPPFLFDGHTWRGALCWLRFTFGSKGPSPSTVSPSSTKNAVVAARSSTTMWTFSRRWIVM
jgi:hypothetical protein